MKITWFYPPPIEVSPEIPMFPLTSWCFHLPLASMPDKVINTLDGTSPELAVSPVTTHITIILPNLAISFTHILLCRRTFYGCGSLLHFSFPGCFSVSPLWLLQPPRSNFHPLVCVSGAVPMVWGSLYSANFFPAQVPAAAALVSCL